MAGTKPREDELGCLFIIFVLLIFGFLGISSNLRWINGRLDKIEAKLESKHNEDENDRLGND